MTENVDVMYQLDKGGKVPKKGRSADIAYDMYTSKDAFLFPSRLKATVVPSGLHTAFDEEKYGLFISPRSGIMKYPIMLANSTGVIEGGYRGDVGFPLKNTLAISASSFNRKLLVIGEDGTLESKETHKFFEDGSHDNDYYEELSKLFYDNSLIYEKLNYKAIETQLKQSINSHPLYVPTGTLFIPKGTRLCQAYLVEKKEINFVEVDKLPKSDRGNNGYGSSGIN